MAAKSRKTPEERQLILSEINCTETQDELTAVLSQLGIVSDGKYYSNKIAIFFKDDLMEKLQTFNPQCNSDNFGELIYWNINRLSDYPVSCESCDKNITEWVSWASTYNKKYCSLKCSNSHSGKISKAEATNIARYGVKNPYQCEEIREKAIKTNIERYGGVMINATNELRRKYNGQNPFSTEEVQNKIKKTNLSKYGHEVASKSDAVKLKTLKTNSKLHHGGHHTREHLEEHSIEIYTDKDKFVEMWNEVGKHETLSQLGLSHSKINKLAKLYGIDNSKETMIESFIGKILNDCDVIYEKNIRSIIPPYELDFYLPEHKLAIECNGLYWHGEKSHQKDKNYHLSKTLKCNDAGIQLIHIFENEIYDKTDIIRSRVNSKLNKNRRVYARKCKVQKVSNGDEREFFNSTHTQGYVRSSERYGLFYEDELVALMSFGKSRFNKKFDYELLRYSSKLEVNVIGGAGKLFNHFVKEHDPKSIISYADRRWGEGKFYEKIGFTFNNSSPPNYWYYKGNSLYSRINFQKHKLPNKLKKYNNKLTEWQNMQENGWDRVWDCGNNVYHWETKT